ncbi:hypothetical protein AK812_SmicGene16033 [Symbiodinium microadriaticum]|uniref:Uncharacterized protein n=1 Tax=Symbiodinium microadriaticum TaxID=2951 RepID=A0A1Q9E1B8_SYMMI|nr:hypothetical protein AK812_SmicGene16033 [Symbiodinium microadriaticum]
MAGGYATAGLAEELDNLDDVRGRVRGGGLLEDGSLGQDSSNRVAVQNSSIAVPLLVRLSLTRGLQLPSVEGLRMEVKKFYDMHSREVTDSQVDDSAWFCRRLVVFVKMKAQKKLVSMDYDFQDLCLVVRPDLQELVDDIRAQQQPDEDDPEAAAEAPWGIRSHCLAP